MARIIRVGELCDQLAKLARTQDNCDNIHVWLKLAANEAHLCHFTAQIELPDKEGRPLKVS